MLWDVLTVNVEVVHLVITVRAIGLKLVTLLDAGGGLGC